MDNASHRFGKCSECHEIICVDHITLAQDEYFIVDVTGTVFKYGLAIDLTSLPTDKVMSEGKKSLSQLNPDDAKLVLNVYDLFKKA